MRANPNYLHIALLIVSMAWLLSACNLPADLPTQPSTATLPSAAEEPARAVTGSLSAGQRRKKEATTQPGRAVITRFV